METGRGICVICWLRTFKVSFDTDAKGRTHIDVSELTRVYGTLQNGTPAEHPAPVNDTHPIHNYDN